jgi:hypothetical protein
MAFIAAAALAVPAVAKAGLAPPQGPWPAPEADASNPLRDTPFALNGGEKAQNASLRVWLPVAGSRQRVVTRTFGARAIARNRDTKHPCPSCAARA